jgi:anaerobic magnesium-protoporphyrin IX monomethyl ester cyclase
MGDVVLVFPSTGIASSQYRMLPLSVLMVAAPLEARGYSVRIIDQRGHPDWRQELKDELAAQRPVMVGISSMTGRQILGGLSAARVVREAAPGVPIVWGGVHPSLLPEETVAHDLVDIVVVGEGEVTAVELADALRAGAPLSKVAGLCFKENGRVTRTPERPFADMASLPEPAYHLVDVERYRVAPLLTGEKSLPLLTSRGCPFRCGYCYNVRFNHRSWRALPAAEVVRRMRAMKERFGVSGILLLDDNFFVNLGRVREICRLLIEQRLDLAIHNANCRADTLVRLDDELLGLLNKAGFTQILIGVESGAPGVLERMKKDITPEQVLESNRLLRRHGIKPYFTFMAGFPYETVSDVRSTLAFMSRLLDENPDAVLSRLSLIAPYPGTELLDDCVEAGLRRPTGLDAWAHCGHANLNFSGFDRAHVGFLKKAQLISFFLDRKKIELDNRILRSMAALYSRVVRERARRGFYAGMPELVLARGVQKALNAYRALRRGDSMD